MVKRLWASGLLLALGCAAVHAASGQYTYDSLNRLTRAAYVDGTTIVYTYDAAGNRLSQVIASPTVPAPILFVDKPTLSFSSVAGQASAGSQLLVIRNDGGGSMQWSVTSSVPWLSVSPISGTNAGVVTVSASAVGLAAGRFPGSLTIYPSSGAPATIPVTFAVTAAPSNPAIAQGGIVDAAGYRASLARGGIARLLGDSLATATGIASTIPLPRTLGGVRVSVNGVDAPLWMVSLGQINFQVPFETPVGGVVPVVVYRDAAASPPVNVRVELYAPGVFMYESSPGVFDPIITHPNGDLVSAADPAVPSEVVTVWGTGIGDLTVPVQTGAAAPLSPPAESVVKPVVSVGGSPAEVKFSGLAPTAVGLAQFNIKLPDSLPDLASVPLVIQFGDASSQPVNLAVQAGRPTVP